MFCINTNESTNSLVNHAGKDLPNESGDETTKDRYCARVRFNSFFIGERVIQIGVSQS